jgi:hypothetical protein
VSTPSDPFSTPPSTTPAWQQTPTWDTAPGQPQGYGPPPQGGQGAAHGWPAETRTETKAMVALGLAIAAYTPTIPFIGAIAALVLARMARRDILASGGRLTGLSLCTWAVVLAWLHLLLVVLLVVLLGGLLLLPFSFS